MSDELKYKINDLESFDIDLAVPENTWDSLRQRCPTLSEWGVETLRDGLDGHVQSIILEPFYTCKDHRNLYSNFYSKKFLEVTSNCNRLHFFNRANVKPKDLLSNEDEFKKHYIGFSVIRPVNIRCLGRTVIDPYKIGRGLKEGYYLLRTAFKARVNGADFEVCGYPFTAQDADATLCAHSALWGVCRYFSERYTHYKELFPFDFIRMTENSKGRAVPYRGMTYTDYCKILSDFGTYPIYRVLQKRDATDKFITDPEAFQDLYSYVESGFPVLASLRLPAGGSHVVSLIGHTMDINKAPGTKFGFVDSSHFLKQFVAVDDNFFPYQLLGYQGDLENYGVYYEDKKSGETAGIGHVYMMTCPLPEKVFLPAEDARKKALKHCEKFLSNLKLTGAEPFVTRLFVTNSASFKKRKLADAKRGDRAASLVLSLHLPHFIWVMEISPLAVYKGGKCTAEVVLDATAGAAEEAMIYIRIGPQMYFAGSTSTIYKKIEGSPDQFPQYTHNLGEKGAVEDVPTGTKS